MLQRNQNNKGDRKMKKVWIKNISMVTAAVLCLAGNT